MSVSDDIAELIGGKPDSRIDRALSRLTAQRRADQSGDMDAIPDNYKPLHDADVRHGVSVGLLSQIFGMDPTTIKKKLKECPPLYRRKAGFIYDLKTAAQYLVQPVFNAEDYLKTMKSSDLPTHLQDEFWSAQIKRQKWEENAAHLWRTESVIEVLGDVMQSIKFSMQLWPDVVERALGLSQEQRAMLIVMADNLQAEIHKKLLQMPAEKQSLPILAEQIVTNGHDAASLV